MGHNRVEVREIVLAVVLRGLAVGVGVATVAGDAGQVTDVLDACERLLAERPEVTLLSTHRQLFSETD